jgi:hypothetical protein
MNGQYSEIGVGSARGEYKGQPTIFVVQLFGTTRKPQNELTQASGVSETVSSDVVIENVTSGATESTVAPATVSIVEATPSETSFETKVDETHSAIVSDSPMTLEDEGESSIVYTSLATTSREGEPVPVSEMAGSTSGNSVPLLTLRGATEPSLWLETFYAVLAFAVIVALMVSLMLEWKRHHPVQIAYAGGLLAVMALLLYIHTSLTSMVLIV